MNFSNSESAILITAHLFRVVHTLWGGCRLERTAFSSVLFHRVNTSFGITVYYIHVHPLYHSHTCVMFRGGIYIIHCMP